MVNQTQPQGTILDFGAIDPIYIYLILGIVFFMIMFVMMWLYRGVPTQIMKANLFKKDLLLISLGNNRLTLAIPKIVANWYYVKSGKKKSGVGGYFYISADSTERFSGTVLSFANAHQAMTIPLPTTEVMSNLQKEQLMGLRINSYSDIDTIIEYGELLNKQESERINKKKVTEVPEELEMKYHTIIEQMRDLTHLTQLTVPQTGKDKTPHLLSVKDVERLKQLIAQSRNDNDLLKNISKDDLKLIGRAEGQLIRGQTSNLRGIRGFLDGKLRVPHPKVIDNLVEDVVSKMSKAQDMLRTTVIIVALLIGAGIAAAVIFMLMTGNGGT